MNVTSITMTPGAGDAEIPQINVEGSATLDGNEESVIGTLTLFPNVEATTGRWEWCSRGFAENSTRVGRGGGFFVRDGNQTHCRGTISGSDGANFATEGALDIVTRTFSGKAYAWE
jgi:hypothetical protein